MPKIDNDIKLDFDDVLIVPQRSTLTSRSEIQLERTFHFYHSPRTWTGIPIMCANMSFCSFEIAKSLAKHKMIACLHKYHAVEQLYNYFKEHPENIDYTFVSIGYKKSDLNHLLELKDKLGKQPNICIDVPNGHMDVFVKYCHKVRENFPESIIIAGNVTNTSSTQELLIYGGVDIVKVGIGGGCFVEGTKVYTKYGYVNIEDITTRDMVLTHDLKYRRVIGTSTRLENDAIISINDIRCTPNHLFRAVHKNYISLGNYSRYITWIPAADLNKDYMLLRVIDNKIELQEIYSYAEEETQPVIVYDIEVDIDHSFIVNDGIVVHNSACTTRMLTACGVPQLSACLENSYAAHGLQNGPKKLGLIVSDGGHKNVGDVCKALCAGADFVMLGGYFAGSESCDGEWEYEYYCGKGSSHPFWQPLNPGYETEKRKTKFTYYGMSTHYAQEKYEDNIKSYRASEGTKIAVKYKGTTDKVIQELFGGIRSCCSYIGAVSTKDMNKCGSFCRVNKIHNNTNPILGV